MIDIQKEEVVSFSEAAKRLPRRRAGKKPHVATLYRWASRGLRGSHLETIQIGGTMCTSVEALQRFFGRLSAPTEPEGDGSKAERTTAIGIAKRLLEGRCS